MNIVSHFEDFLAADFAKGSTAIVAPTTERFGGCAVQIGLAIKHSNYYGAS